MTLTGANANRYPHIHGHQSHARTHAHTSHTAVVYVGPIVIKINVVNIVPYALYNINIIYTSYNKCKKVT